MSSSRRTSFRRGGAEDELDVAGIATGLVDGLVEVELGGEAGARELAQAAQRHPHLPPIEGDVGAVVLEAALAGHLHRRSAAALAADANAGRMLAAVSVGRSAAGADPAPAAVVTLVLLGEGFEEASA